MAPTDLFDSFRLGPCLLRNRMVMAPMTRYRSPHGVPVTLNAEYYAQRASAGLIITESAAVSQQGVAWLDSPGIFTQDHIDGWKLVTEAVHRQGGCIYVQLFHAGRRSCNAFQPGNQMPVAPSALRSTGSTVTVPGQAPEPHSMPRALRTDEIEGIVDQFRQGAYNAMLAGFDGVELHAANGFLLDQFLRDGSNRRTDEYGGTVKNRTRLLMSVVEAATSVIGADRVGVHVSPTNPLNDMNDSNPKELFLEVAQALNAFAGLYLHVVEGVTGVVADAEKPYQYLRRAFRGTYIANNLYDLERAQHARRTRSADLISFGRLFIANPDLARRFQSGAALNTLDQQTIRSKDHRGYTDYPFLPRLNT